MTSNAPPPPDFSPAGAPATPIAVTAPHDGAAAACALAGRSAGDVFRPAGKRSMTIAGHATSIRIEPLFWDALIRESVIRGLPVNALVAQIDVQRLAVEPPPNLASAIRLWVFAAVMDRVDSISE
ncbi:MAG: ribbon-helix-helix domain-containing protein [Sphingopyxis sp.]